MKKEHIRSLFVLLNLICSSAYAQRTACVEAIPGSRKKIAYSFHAQADIVPESQILDCSMIPIGATNISGYGIWRDPDKLYKGMPSYHFKMKDDKERRVDLQALYVTQSDIVEAGLTQQEIQDHQSVLSLYHFGKGEAKKGERWVYEYGLYLPSSIDSNSSGIITQWHGMPDRTTMKKPDGTVVKYALNDFKTQIMSTMYFKRAIAYNKSSDKENGYIRDYGGNPPVALKVGDGYLYLVCRVDYSRVTIPGERIHMRPPLASSKTSPEGNKKIFGVWEKRLSQLPKNQWMDMKFEIYWSKWKNDGSGIIDDGNIKFYVDGKLLADWSGPLGNNDEHGSYFKYGIYVPGSDGIEVWAAGFNQYRVDSGGANEQ